MPGTIIRERRAGVARSLPTSTGTLFLAGPSDRGNDGWVESLVEFVKKFGDRVNYSTAYDQVEAFFRTGGRLLYFSRILGANPVKAHADLAHGGNTAATVRAVSAGAWANTRNVEVIAGDAGGERKYVITDDTDVAIDETTPSFATVDDAIEWFSHHDDLRLEAGADYPNQPDVHAAVSLAGGDDDRANISDDTADTSLDKFLKGYGPGQVAFAGRTSDVAHGQLADIAAQTNRAALYDPPDTTDKATLLTAASAIHDLSNARHGALFAPWVRIPALSGGGALRSIPPSAVVAGVIAFMDSTGHSANEPAAGINGIVPWVVDLKAEFSDDDASDLNDASVNLIRNVAGDLRVYGYRSGVTKSADSDWWQFGNVRLYMEIAAKADNILERFVLRQIDGRGLIFKDLQGLLTGMLLPYWESGALYGAEPSDAFYVDTSSQVNTSDTINDGEIHAVIELTMSPMGETVILEIVKNQIGG